jgi:hypothetical protein
MITTKNQIINILFSDYAGTPILNRMIKVLNRWPEQDFCQLVKNDLNWKLDPIRRGVYIVTI